MPLSTRQSALSQRRVSRRGRKPTTRLGFVPRIEQLEDRLLLSVSMTDLEQMLWYQVNRARSNPTAEAALHGVGLNDGLPSGGWGLISASAKPPLAPNQSLVNAAALHSQDMLDRDYFAHDAPLPAPNGVTPQARATTAGYTGAVGENIHSASSWPAGTLDQDAFPYTAHAGLFQSPGHRANMLYESYNEVGTGIRFESVGAGDTGMAAESLGIRSSGPILAGVVFNDGNGNSAYDVHEGLGGVTVTVDGTPATTTNAAGGWDLTVSAGTHGITVSGAGFVGTGSAQVTVGTQNREVDFISGSAGAIVDFQPVAPPAQDLIGAHRAVGNAGYFIQEYNGNGYWDGGDRFFSFGYDNDTPIIGDWNGDGQDQIGVHRAVGDAGYFIQDYNGNGYWDGGDRFFIFGYGTDTPIIGDWNGDGQDQIGVHRAVGNAGFFIQDYNGNGYWDGGDRFFIFGYGTDTPIIGDWNGDGEDQIGVHRGVGNAGYFIQEYNSNGYWDGGDRFFIFGYDHDTPIIGDWNGDGMDQIGVHRAVGNAGYFIQEYNSNGYWDAGDRFFIFGYGTDTPMIGNWASAAPLMAASESATAEADVAPLTADAMAPVVQTAINNWSSAVPLTTEQIKTLRELNICVADLPGARLGQAFGTTITLDINAAGHGWFVDTTPWDNVEFTPYNSTRDLTALPGSSARNRMDLLTAVMHELGHVLGLEDLDPLADSVMSSKLEQGLRRGPGDAERHAVLSCYGPSQSHNAIS